MKKRPEKPVSTPSPSAHGMDAPGPPAKQSLSDIGKKPPFTQYVPQRIQVSVSVSLDFAELAQWDSQRIQALMRGIAELAKARGESPNEKET